jgi:hypothetical protein
MEGFKAFWGEHYDFRYNMAETYECRAHKLQHDFIEIDRRVRNDIVEFLSRTQLLIRRNYTPKIFSRRIKLKVLASAILFWGHSHVMTKILAEE